MKKYILTLLMIFCTEAIFALNPMNPVVNYFSGLLDETKAEIAAGDLMEKAFMENVALKCKIEQSDELTSQMIELSEKSSRKNLKYKVYVIDSDILDEILFPNGSLFITKGLMKFADTQHKLNFILARNVIHMSYKHPFKLIKRSGLYPELLKQLKLPVNKRDNDKIINSLRNYLLNLGQMEFEKADSEGIKLTKDPEKTRISAIEMLKQFKVIVWPVMPLDTIDTPQRLKKLQEINLSK